VDGSARDDRTQGTERVDGEWVDSERLLAARFPDQVHEPQLLETHISWVVLTGQWAYKVKKPVRFGFVDYSTSELRRRYCDRELELNRRWAPELYRDVVPIFVGAGLAEVGGGEGRLRFGEAGESPRPGERLVDHAVKMFQFTQESLLINRLAAGEVEPRAMERLGLALAQMHAKLPIVSGGEGLARSGSIDPERENFEVLERALPAGDPDREKLVMLRRWSDAAAERLRPLLIARAAGGAVRECHGDLHLGNLLLLDDRFVPFDGIEFSDNLRQIDRWDEVAFLVMELAEHGYERHAHRLVDSYAEAADDYEGLGLLRYYLVGRAMVRAKVDHLRQRQVAEGSGGGDVLSAAGRRYIAYACGVTGPRPRELWMTWGLSGSGKSTQAARLVEQRGYVRIRSDVQRKRLAGIDPWQREKGEGVAPDIYTAAMNERTYGKLLELARVVLEAGFGVVVDATFLGRGQREPFIRLAREVGVPAACLVCRAEPEELERRLKGRDGDPSDATWEVMLAQRSRAEEPVSEEGARVVDAADLAWDGASGAA
jgi:aminoglycoside phosphotransferase family enzyme/predicted kinase